MKIKNKLSKKAEKLVNEFGVTANNLGWNDHKDFILENTEQVKPNYSASLNYYNSEKKLKAYILKLENKIRLLKDGK